MVETRGGRRFAVLFFVASFLVLLLGRWLQPVDRVALTIAAPFSAAINGVANTVGDTISSVADGPRLQQEVDRLTKENAQLNQQIVADARARHENALFKRMVGFEERNPKLATLAARVIGNGVNYSLTPSVFIDHGTRSGLRAGMTVLDQNGYFIGQIDDLGSDWARVELMLSPSSSVGALDQRSQATGLVEGQYAGRPQLDLVVASASLKTGDVIVTSGQCNLFPPGLIMGQVVGVQHRNVAVYQTATMQPAADFRNLEMAMVVRNFIPAPPSRLECRP